MNSTNFTNNLFLFPKRLLFDQTTDQLQRGQLKELDFLTFFPNDYNEVYLP